jgi:hypothetical protein
VRCNTRNAQFHWKCAIFRLPCRDIPRDQRDSEAKPEYIPLGFSKATSMCRSATFHPADTGVFPKEVSMATKKASKASSSAGKAPKAIKEVMGKSALVAYLSDTSGVAPKDVRAVMAALESASTGSIGKKGAGSFVLPGLLKITAVNVPAKPKRKGINPFTKEEQWFAAKPATTKLKIRALKKLKDAAL